MKKSFLRFILLTNFVCAACFALYSQSDSLELKVNLGHSSRINKMIFSPDGQYLLSCDWQNVYVWDLNSRKTVQEHFMKGVTELGFSPNGSSYFFSSSESGYKIFDFKTGTPITGQLKKQFVNSMTYSPDGNTLVVSYWDYDDLTGMYLYDSHTGRFIEKIDIADLAGSGDYYDDMMYEGIRKITYLSDTLIKIEDFDPIKSEQRILKIDIGSNKIITNSVEPPKDGIVSDKYQLRFKSNVVTGVGKQIYAQSVSSGRIVWELDKVYESTHWGRLSKDELYLYISHSSGLDKINTSSGDIIWSREMSPPDTIAEHAQNNLIAFDNRKGSIFLADSISGQELTLLDGFKRQRLAAYTSDSNFLMSYSVADDLLFWDIDRMQIASKIDDIGYFKNLNADGRSFIAISADGDLQLRSLKDGRVRKTYNIELPYNYEMEFSDDSKYMLIRTLGEDSMLWIYEVVTGQLVFKKSFSWLYGSYFHPDNKQIIVSTGKPYDDEPKMIYTYNIASGAAVRQFEIVTGYTGTLFRGVSADGSKMINFHNNTIYCYDMHSGRQLWSFATNQISNHIRNVKFTNDKQCIAVSQKGDFYFINEQSGRLIQHISTEDDTYGFFEVSDEGAHLTYLTSDSILKTIHIPSGKRVCSSFAASESEWISWTDDGYFHGTESAIKKYVYVQDGLDIYDIDQFSSMYHRPDIIAARLQGIDTGIAENSILDGFLTPPDVALLIKTKDGSFKEVLSDINVRGLARVQTLEAQDWDVSNGQIRVRLVAENTGGGIDGLRLFQGNKAVTAYSLSETTSDTVADYIVSLAKGENHIRAVGFSNDKTESEPIEIKISFAPAEPIRPVLHVLIAAADTYRNPKYKLDYAIADANGFADAIQLAAESLFSSVNITKIYESELTEQALRQHFQQTAQNSSPDDVFIFYYAGHGIALEHDSTNEFFFILPAVTQMTSLDKVLQKGLSSTDFKAAISAIPATKQMILIDACNSGALAQGFVVRGAAEEIALNQLARASGSVVITATNDQQFASEVDTIGHGVFTYALIKGLEGEAAKQDGRITAASLRSWIDDEVPELAEQYRGILQFPTTFMYGQDFPIGLGF